MFGVEEGFGAFVEHAGDEEHGRCNQAGHHLDMARCPRALTAPMPSRTKPMWLTELRAIRRLTESRRMR